MNKLHIFLPVFLLLVHVHAAAQDGRNIQISGTDQLQAALDSSQPGDTIWLHEGTYPGNWSITRSGEAGQPITLRPFGQDHVIILGRIAINASFITLYGLDITDPNDMYTGDGVDIYAGNVHLINNVIHDACNTNGLGAWNTGPNQVFYGNIFYRNGCNPQMTPDGSRLTHGHNIYTQNNYELYGTKVFDSNLILEAGCENNCGSLQAYTEEGSITGFLFRNNIFADGRALQGSRQQVVEHTTYDGNVFLDESVRFGYRAPLVREISVRNNVFASSSISTVFAASPKVEWEGNQYSGIVDITQIGLSVPSLPFTPVSTSYRVIQNAYEPSTYYVAVWSASTFTLSEAFTVYDAYDLWGAPVTTETMQVNLAPGVYVIHASSAVALNPSFVPSSTPSLVPTDHPAATVLPSTTLEPTATTTQMDSVATVLPSATLEPTATATLAASVTPLGPYPTAQSFPTLPPPAQSFPTVELPVEIATTTDTLPPAATFEQLLLPASASMDGGPSDWLVLSGWTLATEAAYGNTGLGWQPVAGSQTGVLRRNRQLDLRAVLPGQRVQLTFESMLSPQLSNASVQISLDAVNWLTLGVATPTGMWRQEMFDLSEYAGQEIWVQFIWAAVAPLSSEEAKESWWVDKVSAAITDVPVHGRNSAQGSITLSRGNVCSNATKARWMFPIRAC